jgi:hypothetical protein
MGPGMSVFSLAGFAAHLLTMEADVELGKQMAVERACRMVEKEAKRVLGTYDYGWEPLKQATIELAHGGPAHR